jgi:hypothetical protein
MRKENVNVLSTLKPRLFKSTTVTEPSKANYYSQNSFNSEISVGSTSSFRYDPIGAGLKSTQQLNVDWSDFAQHVFYNSAQVKTNEAFKTIINNYPFDGTKKENEEFVDSLTGFQKYVLDSLPTNFGYFYANGTGYISTIDVTGAEVPSMSIDKRGKSILSPGTTSSFSAEFWLWVPSQSNGNSIVFQKLSGSTHGITCWLSNSTSATVNIGFTVCSHSTMLSISQSIQKGEWTHCGFSWDRTDSINSLEAYKNGNLISSSNGMEIGDLGFDAANLYIFSGSSFQQTGTSQFVPTEIVSGAIDEFRIWHQTLTSASILQQYKKNIFAQDNLVLYYRFNEPTDISRNLILDYSGYSLFGSSSTRSFSTSSIVTSSMSYEQAWLNPVLFANNSELVALKSRLLTSASLFDDENPSLITNLFPQHYLLEGQIQDGLETEVGGIISSSLDSDSIPRTAKLGSTQTLLSLMYSMATFFDEIQLFIKEFGNLIHVDYDDTNVISDYFLQFLAARYGIELPAIFNGSSIDQFIDGNNIADANSSTTEQSLKYVQNQLWKRILVNAKHILNSKGTRHSINLFLRSIGIEPNSLFRIKEYGGPIQKSLNATREQRQDITGFLQFTTSSYLSSSYLSSSRTEPGYPVITGTSKDGLLTSGSWSYEALYKLNSSSSISSQSLARISAKTTASNQEGILANLIAYNSNSLRLIVQPNTAFSSTDAMDLYLTGAFNLFDNSIWHVSFGKERADNVTNNTSPSSSFFIRLAKQSFGEIIESYTTATFYNDNGASINTNLFSNHAASLYHPSGNFISIGSASISSSLAGLVSSETRFDGKVSQIKFWSKFVEETEWKEHVRNFKSIGTIDPLKTNQFEIKDSGSFEKIRLDCSIVQSVTESNSSGEIVLFDYSQNNFHMSGSGFPTSQRVIIPQIIYYSILSPNFDEAVTYSKVRVRSLETIENIDESYIEQAPVYEIPMDEQPTDNTKLSIDFSVTDALNQDIINVFGSFEELNNIFGDPSAIFASEYVGLENLRKAYFKRLTNSINLKSFFEMYKWFNDSLGTFISQLIGRNVKYKGINFVVQPHMLERSKVQYYFFNQYLNRSLSAENKDVLTVQLLNGGITKF